MTRLDENWLSLGCQGRTEGQFAIHVTGGCMDSDKSPVRVADNAFVLMRRINLYELLHTDKFIGRVIVFTYEGGTIPCIKQFVGCSRLVPVIRDFSDLRKGLLHSQEVAEFKFYKPKETLIRIDASRILLAFEVERVIDREETMYNQTRNQYER